MLVSPAHATLPLFSARSLRKQTTAYDPCPPWLVLFLIIVHAQVYRCHQFPADTPCIPTLGLAETRPLLACFVCTATVTAGRVGNMLLKSGHELYNTTWYESRNHRANQDHLRNEHPRESTTPSLRDEPNSDGRASGRHVNIIEVVGSPGCKSQNTRCA